MYLGCTVHVFFQVGFPRQSFAVDIGRFNPERRSCIGIRFRIFFLRGDLQQPELLPCVCSIMALEICSNLNCVLVYAVLLL